MLRASSAESCEKKTLNAESGARQRFKVNENRIESLSNDLQDVKSAQSGFYLKTQAESLQQRLRSEINSETVRAKDDVASIRTTLNTALTRLSDIEKSHAELKAQHTQLEHHHAGLITHLCATTANHESAISSLKTDLSRAQADAADLRNTISLQEHMLLGLKSNIVESRQRADSAMGKATMLQAHMQRWLDEEMRKKRAEEEARKAREAEEQRKREEEHRRAEEQRKKAEAEALERLRKAKAEVEERRRQAEAEAARLREEAKKAADEARKRAQEHSAREANAERERRKEEQARREREKQEWARRSKERQERKKAENNILARWALYEAPLADALTFDTIVWPVLVPPVDVSDLALAAICEFIFSTAHSKDKDNKQRLRDAFKLWHTDKCSAVKSRVPEEKPLIEEAFHTISVHLNDLNASMKTEDDADK